MYAAPTSLEVCVDGALSPDGAAAFTSLSRDVIDDAIKAGEIEVFRFGRRVLIAKTEAVRWLAGIRDAYLEKRAREFGTQGK